MLNNHVAAHILARRWKPRRIYVDPVQYAQLIKYWAGLATPAHTCGSFWGNTFIYMGVSVHLVSRHVAAKIREWDLAP